MLISYAQTTLPDVNQLGLPGRIYQSTTLPGYADKLGPIGLWPKIDLR